MSEKAASGGSHGSTRVILYALAANFGIALAKLVGSALSQSASLFAEAIHSLVDCSNQVFLLIGNKKASQVPDELHPLGYGRETFFWSFIVAVFLFSLGGLFAIYEGVHKIYEEKEMQRPEIALGILVLSVALETVSFRACLKEIRLQNPYPNLWMWFRKSTAADLIVIFTEDLAALVGLVVATACTLLAWATGNMFWDALGSILVGVVLVVVAAFLAVEIKSLLVGEAPATNYQPRLAKLMEKYFPKGRVLRVIALQVGNSDVLMSCKIHPGDIATAKELIDSINQFEVNLKEQCPEIRWLFIEPDYYD